MKRRLLALLTGLGMFAAQAAQVNIVERMVVDGVTNAVGTAMATTGSDFVGDAAPSVAGYIFTGWTASDTQGFARADAFGRAYDTPHCHIYVDTTFIAQYLPEEQDEDDDGVADGWELYWYGDLDASATSDTDQDGYTFAEEVAAGTSPLMPDRTIRSGVVYGDSDEWVYNPHRFPKVTFRCEPDGAAFETYSEYCVPDTLVVAPELSSDTDGFAYWELNGQRLADAFGRAQDAARFAMPSNDVVVTAVCVTDATDRAKLYWYGTTSVDLASDTDHDGYTFAEELAAGTSPVMADRTIRSGVVYGDSDEWVYNPHQYGEVTFRSDPEGALFATYSVRAVPGETVVSPVCSRTTTDFACWTRDGARITDAFGRAVDCVTLTMPGGEDITLTAVCVSNETDRAKLYWYGTTSVDLASDTDHDGYTFAEELAAGTSPIMADRTIRSGVVYGDSDAVTLNLQPFETLEGATVDGSFQHIFYNPLTGDASEDFGVGLTPVVADVTGDGLWDIILMSAKGTNVLVNVGTKGNPSFARRGGDGVAALPSDVLDMNSTAKLAAMSLDVEPVGALSATTNGAAMLVSDADGRIWYYAREGASDTVSESARYILQHKVWGGSFAGFVSGAMLAAVDWEDDGDLDCLCGTADGKLLLLRDPKAGRPTGLVAAASADNVLLTWDPNRQTRVRGYRVYRNDDLGRGQETASTMLPTYRDTDLDYGTYRYQVSSVSRFYRTGNSTPVETESPLSEAAEAEVGYVTFTWSDFTERRDGTVVQELSLENAMHYDAAGLVVTNEYDAEAYEFVRVEKSRLSEGLRLDVATPSAGVVVVSVTDGAAAPGRGTFLTFVFKPKANPPGRRKRGDVDGDGDVDEDDLRLLGALKDRPVPPQDQAILDVADLNRNGRLDSGDYQLLRRMLQEGGAK